MRSVAEIQASGAVDGEQSGPLFPQNCDLLCLGIELKKSIPGCAVNGAGRMDCKEGISPDVPLFGFALEELTGVV